MVIFNSYVKLPEGKGSRSQWDEVFPVQEMLGISGRTQEMVGPIYCSCESLQIPTAYPFIWIVKEALSH